MNTLKSVLLLSPTRREREQVPAIAAEMGLNIIFDEFDFDYFDSYLTDTPNLSAPKLDLMGLIDRTVDKYKYSDLRGVTSAVGYPGALAASIIAEELSLPGPSIAAVLTCDHKYYSRLEQKRLVPEATPGFYLIDPACPNDLDGNLKFPIFLKPVKGCMSRNARRIDSRRELDQRIATSLLSGHFIEPFDEALRRYTDLTQSAAQLIREDFLVGSQVSLEGYVSYGSVKVLGIIDAIMVPGTSSFERFQYPSTLPAQVLSRMEDIASRFFSGIG